MAREGQGYPCYQRDMMMMIEVVVIKHTFFKNPLMMAQPKVYIIIKDNVEMFSFSTMILLAMHLVHQKDSFSQRK